MAEVAPPPNPLTAPAVSAEELAAEHKSFAARSEVHARKVRKMKLEVQKFVERMNGQWPEPTDRKLVARLLEGHANMMSDQAHRDEKNQKEKKPSP